MENNVFHLSIIKIYFVFVLRQCVVWFLVTILPKPQALFFQELSHMDLCNIFLAFVHDAYFSPKFYLILIEAVAQFSFRNSNLNSIYFLNGYGADFAK